jgi:hypothetical protein
MWVATPPMIEAFGYLGGIWAINITYLGLSVAISVYIRAKGLIKES